MFDFLFDISNINPDTKGLDIDLDALNRLLKKLMKEAKK